MKKITLQITISFCLLYIASNSQELKGEEIYTKINNAIVTIYTSDSKGKFLSQGSGVVLNDKGWVVTNYHVFAGADKLVVKHKDKIIEFTNIVGLDVEKDILILKIKDYTFQSIKIGNSDLLKVGQKIYAVGSPLGFENTITEGIISGLRYHKGKAKDFIQISAAISHGSSGGAIIDNKGELIGISTLTVTEGQNLNFAIPINEVLTVYKQEGVKQIEIDAAVFFYRGNYEFEKENYDAAIDNYKKSLALFPDAATTNYNLGYAFVLKQEFDTAIYYLQKAIALSQNTADAYSILATCYSSKQEDETAIFYYKKAIALNPNDADTHLGLGFSYWRNQDNETAIFYYKKAIALRQDDAAAYSGLAASYSSKGENETAIFYYKKAIALDPNDADAYRDLGCIYVVRKELDLGISYLKKALSIGSENVTTFFCLGNAYDWKGDEKMANYYLEKAYKLNPSLRK